MMTRKFGAEYAADSGKLPPHTSSEIIAITGIVFTLVRAALSGIITRPLFVEPDAPLTLTLVRWNCIGVGHVATVRDVAILDRLDVLEILGVDVPAARTAERTVVPPDETMEKHELERSVARFERFLEPIELLTAQRSAS